MKRVLFYIVIAIAAFGLFMNLDDFVFDFVKMLVSFAIIAAIIYGIYYFFFLTEDQRKYKKAVRKAKKHHRKR
ncbi:SA1362 family protein [Staphylococcus kloosii]|uniref:SA1362 family protein n=1 Tax=Staphylococcus kloosii TaxID=29384 RepID=UPI0028A3B320|nr:SA1362 family protein [Staphylococcus kloosii]MDT3959465.1 SA1362 family protein [Staphylococcus kloosii]